MLIALSPFIGLAALGIKLTSPGSVFYKQKRMAKDGKTFILYKFRTMVDNAERDSGPVLAAKNDLRVTKIGRFLRDTRIDEIPQLINVIRGEMSLVGPRPERPHFVKCHQSLRETRLAVKPGVTGLAQIRNHYDLRPKHKIKYDVLYIQRRSLALNLYILFKTIPVVLLRKGQ
jgi:lipopolysaccharide/colanic/teichoic acid biosynthesis glycosyltransferase